MTWDCIFGVVSVISAIGIVSALVCWIWWAVQWWDSALNDTIDHPLWIDSRRVED